MKRLIVNADDFGLTRGINRGIVRAFTDGIVTSASLLVSADAFEEAVALARQHSGLDVGLHLALVGERAVLGREVPSLADENGRLIPTFGEFIRRVSLGRINWDEVELEMAAQIARFRETGLPLTHIDSHQHLHMLPPVFHRLCRLLQTTDGVWIRNASPPWRAGPGGSPKRRMQRLALDVSAAVSRASAPALRPKMPDGLLGFECSGCLDRPALEKILRRVPRGLSELVCHPGEGDEETTRKYGHWGYCGSEELAALTAAEVRGVLLAESISLTSFRRPNEEMG